jgi:hypothetical protein
MIDFMILRVARKMLHRSRHGPGDRSACRNWRSGLMARTGLTARTYRRPGTESLASIVESSFSTTDLPPDLGFWGAPRRLERAAYFLQRYQPDVSASHQTTGYSPRPVGGSVASAPRALRSSSKPALVRGKRAWWQ